MVFFRKLIDTLSTIHRSNREAKFKDWESRRIEFVERSNRDRQGRAYTRANASAIIAALAGRGPDASDPDPDQGAHAVANIASVHVPDFVWLSLRGDPKPYKNGYDLGRYRIGDHAPPQALKVREIVDRALPIPSGASPADIYFCATELNGAGVRFYGDVSLVIRKNRVAQGTVVLDRNSYDLVRAPIADRVAANPAASRDRARRAEARQLAGTWGADLGNMATIKVLGELGGGTRRLTTGRISDSVLTDEDYMEVLRIGSFGISDLLEARTSASDAAYETLIGERLQQGPTPRYEALLWRQRRRRADTVLQLANVSSRVVVTMGRVKS